jgi:hypothetical protein
VLVPPLRRANAQRPLTHTVFAGCFGVYRSGGVYIVDSHMPSTVGPVLTEMYAVSLDARLSGLHSSDECQGQSMAEGKVG